MKYSDKCECCEYEVVAYTHNLNAPLVDALEKIVTFYEQQQRSCNLQKDLELTKNQYNNFQKLRYFNLVEHTEKGWVPTYNGIGFIKGKCVVYNKVATFGNKILSNDHIAWSTEKKKAKLVHIQQIKGYIWKPKLEWQMEKARADQLF